jgi:hypothetical protein
LSATGISWYDKEKEGSSVKKSFWRGLCITCIVLSVPLALFHVVIVGLAAAGAVLFALMTMSPEILEGADFSWGAVYANFVGSPLFWVDIVMAAVLILSIVMWILCKRRENRLKNSEV